MIKPLVCSTQTNGFYRSNLWFVKYGAMVYIVKTYGL